MQRGCFHIQIHDWLVTKANFTIAPGLALPLDSITNSNSVKPLRVRSLHKFLPRFFFYFLAFHCPKLIILEVSWSYCILLEISWVHKLFAYAGPFSHFNHPAWILHMTSQLMPPQHCKMDSRWLNFETIGMMWTLILHSKNKCEP